MLGGNHELRKLNMKVSTSTETSASFFLIVGSLSSTTTEKAKVRFYCLNYQKEYELFEMDLRNVRIKIDSTIQKPFVQFSLNREGHFSYSTLEKPDHRLYQEALLCAINGATIFCKDSDFQPNININDLQ